MKLKYFFPAIAILITSFAIAQNTSSTYPPFGFQQEYIIKNYLSGKDVLKIKTTEQLDQFFGKVEKGWTEYVDDSIALLYLEKIPRNVLYNVDSYSYMFAFYSITKKNQHPKEIEYHLLKDYMLPSLVKDLKNIKEDIDLQAYKLIWPGNSNNTLILGSKYYHDKAIIDDLYFAIAELEKLLRQQSEKLSKEAEKNNSRVLSSLKNYKYDIQAKYFLANDEVEKALELFKTGIINQDYLKVNILPFAKDLAVYLSEVNEKDKAFDMLSTVMRSTFNDEVPRDSLKAIYISIDKEKGEAIYNTTRLQNKRELLKVSDLSLESKLQDWKYITSKTVVNNISQADYILIDFWYSSCTPCMAEIPELNNLDEMLEKREDIVFISVNTDHFITERDMRFVSDLIEKRDIRFPVAFDTDHSNISNQLNIAGYPYKIIINKNGKVMQKVNNSQITLNTFYELLNQEN